MTHDLWTTAHAARGALADDLADLTDDQWATPSLCAGWTVREVVAHLTAAASIGPLRWTWSVLRSRFDFDRHNADRLAEHLGASPAETLARFQRIVPSTTSTFGPVEAWLGEVVVHAEDVRRPLGIAHHQPVEAVTPVAEFLTGRAFTGPDAGRGAAAGGDGRALRHRLRPARVRPDPGADDGDGRAPRPPRRPRRRRRGRANEEGQRTRRSTHTRWWSLASLSRASGSAATGQKTPEPRTCSGREGRT